MKAPIRTPTRPGPQKPSRYARHDRIAAFVSNFIAVATLLAIVLGIGLGIGLDLASAIVGKQELAQTGIQTSATITKHHSKIVRGYRSRTEHFLINYSFTPHNRVEEHNVDVALPVDLWNTVEIGSTISVTYKASYPAHNQPTMILERFPPRLAKHGQIYVGALVAVTFSWLTITLVRRIASQWRKSNADDPGAGVAGAGAAKESRAKHAAPKAQLPEKLRGLLPVFAVLLGLTAALAVFLIVLMFSVDFVGELVVDAIENSLL